MRSLVLRVMVLLLAAAQPVVAFVLFVRSDLHLGALLARHSSHVMPAPYAFGIAIPIFALSIAYGVAQLLRARRDDPMLAAVAVPLALAFFATSLWMVAIAGALYLAAVLVAFGLVVSLGVAAARTQLPPARSPAVETLLRTTVGLASGWAAVGLLGTVGMAMAAYGWAGFGLDHRSWSYFAITLGGFAASGAVAALRGSLAFALGAIWGFVAIAVAQWIGPRAGSAPTVGTAALFAALLVAISGVVAVAKRDSDQRLWARRRGMA